MFAAFWLTGQRGSNEFGTFPILDFTGLWVERRQSTGDSEVSPRSSSSQWIAQKYFCNRCCSHLNIQIHQWKLYVTRHIWISSSFFNGQRSWAFHTSIWLASLGGKERGKGEINGSVQLNNNNYIQIFVDCPFCARCCSEHYIRMDSSVLPISLLSFRFTDEKIARNVRILESLFKN